MVKIELKAVSFHLHKVSVFQDCQTSLKIKMLVNQTSKGAIFIVYKYLIHAHLNSNMCDL